MASLGLHTQRQALPQSRRATAGRPQPFQGRPLVAQRQACVVRAAGDDDDLEARLAVLRKGKGATPDGEGAKAKKRAAAEGGKSAAAAAAAPAKKSYDYTDEKVHWEGGPAAGDLVFNIALGATLVGIPLTIGAIARAAFVRYKFTDKRVSVVTNAPWENKQTDCAYQEVADVRTVSRGLGAWGDMVVELTNGDKLELRSVEKFKELKEYVLARRDTLGGGRRKGGAPAITDLDMDDDEAMRKSKGFA